MARRHSPRLRVGRPDDRRRIPLVSSGQHVTRDSSQYLRRLIQPWQSAALSYYELLGEIHYPATVTGNWLARVRLFPATRDSQGEIEEIDNDPEASDLLNRIQDPGGGTSQWKKQYGLLRFLTGECYMVATEDENTPGGEKWEMLSSSELRVNSDGTYVRFRAPQMTSEQLRNPPDELYTETLGPGEASVYRLFKPSPSFSALADSPMRSVLEVCEELLILTRAIRSRAKSRIAGPGLLLVPDEFSPAPPGGIADEDSYSDPFREDLEEMFLAPLENEGTAADYVPGVIYGESALIGLIKHLQIHNPMETYGETGLRSEAIRRIALGLDIPPEVLLGVGDVNHWGAWQIDEQTAKGHIFPLCQDLCDDLTGTYYRPAAREMGIANWENLVIGYDAAELVIHPDRGKDAMDAYSARAIGKAALREAKGFEDGDAPTEEELDEMLGVAVRDGSLAKYGIPSIKVGGLEPKPGEVEKGPSGGGTTIDTVGQTPAEVSPGPAETSNGNQVASLEARITGAAELAVSRCRELAGSRLRGHAQGCEECREKIDKVANAFVASALGAETLSSLNTPNPKALVRDGALLFETALEDWGIGKPWAEKLGDLVERHAAASLCELRTPPLPAGFTSILRQIPREKVSV